MRNPLASLARELFGHSPERRLALLTALWPKVVGAEVARRSQVVDLQGDKLRVRLTPGVWRRIVGRMRKEILLRLRAAAGPLAPKMLVFVEGQVEEPPEPEARRPVVGATALPDAVAAAAAAIDDPQTRE